MPALAYDFDAALREHGLPAPGKTRVTTLQVNVGKICNQACHHCHVEAGPKRTEAMTTGTATRVLDVLSRSPDIATVDITGGAPELNQNFQLLVKESRREGRHVIDRCNLTILLEPGFEGLPDFLAREEVEITASLPCYTAENVDRQRGRGVFARSIEALRRLNELGYGIEPGLKLNLVYNPGGACLPPPQDKLEADYNERLAKDFGIRFHRLFTITNMPINRFAGELTRIGRTDLYRDLLLAHFNPETVEHLMCRSLVSVGWDGRLYDCDFNQMLELAIPSRRTIWEINSFGEIAPEKIATGSHCFGCTAGPGSSCGGSLS